MLPLYEQFRPGTFRDVVGQDEILRKIEVLARRGLVGRVFWITAHSGQGKTTIARLIGKEIADDYAVIELDAQDLGIDRVRDFERMCEYKPLGKGCHVFIINEAHTLSKRVVDRLKTALELAHVQANSTWVFTTTINEQGQRELFDDDKSGGPFLSRAIQLVLNHGPELELAFAVRARQIAEAELLDGQPLDKYVTLVRDCKCNMRMVLQRVEAGEMLA